MPIDLTRCHALKGSGYKQLAKHTFTDLFTVNFIFIRTLILKKFDYYSLYIHIATHFIL